MSGTIGIAGQSGGQHVFYRTPQERLAVNQMATLIGTEAARNARRQHQGPGLHRSDASRRSLRNCVSSARMAMAISMGVLLPIGKPTGAWSRAS